MATKKAVSKSAKTTTKKPTTIKKSTTVKSRAAVVSPKIGLFNPPFAKKPIYSALIAEFIGTFLLAAAIVTQQGNPLVVLFSVAGIVLLFGAISGSHLNPAVSVGAWATRRISGLRALAYIVVQFIAAGLAFLLLNVFVGGAAPVSPEAQSFGQSAVSLFHATALPAGKEWYVFFAELIGATIIGFVWATALGFKRDRVASSLTIGFGIFTALIIAVSAASYVSGSSILNPAAALSLQALKWELWPLAVYILAPIIGGVLGFIIYDAVKTGSDNE